MIMQRSPIVVGVVAVMSLSSPGPAEAGAEKGKAVSWAAEFLFEHFLSKGVDALWDRVTGAIDPVGLDARVRQAKVVMPGYADELDALAAQAGRIGRLDPESYRLLVLAMIARVDRQEQMLADHDRQIASHEVRIADLEQKLADADRRLKALEPPRLPVVEPPPVRWPLEARNFSDSRLDELAKQTAPAWKNSTSLLESNVPTFRVGPISSITSPLVPPTHVPPGLNLPMSPGQSPAVQRLIDDYLRREHLGRTPLKAWTPLPASRTGLATSTAPGPGLGLGLGPGKSWLDSLTGKRIDLPTMPDPPTATPVVPDDVLGLGTKPRSRNPLLPSGIFDPGPAVPPTGTLSTGR